MLHPDFQVVQGDCALTSEWSIHLPEPFNRRIEDGDLYIWRPGLTLLVAVWGGDGSTNGAARVARLREDASPKAYDVMEEEDEGLIRLAYRLSEKSDDKRKDALYAFVVGASGHLQLAFYFNDDRDLDVARQILRSAKHT